MLPHLALALRTLGRSPGLLFAVCFAASAVLLPYFGVKHDAILYGGQVLNRADPGCLADDLFFKYGSQDKFSAVSPLMTPAVRLIGLPPAFFVGYLLSVAVYVAGAVRLSRALFPDPILAAVVAFVLVGLEMPYGGNRIFNVPEGFFTPRLAACGLALLGLERALAGRWLWVAGFYFLAFALHPLMAVGPAAVAGVLTLIRLVGEKLTGVLIAVAVLAGIGVLAVEPVGSKLFGPMDDEWKAAVKRLSNYNFVSEWAVRDWLRTGTAGLTMLIAAVVGRGTPAGRFFAAVAVVGAVGFAAFAVAPLLPYALFFQGQSYRAVWVWGILHIPAGLWLAAKWWPADDWRRSLAVGLIAAPLLLVPIVPPVWPAAAVVAILVLLWKGRIWQAVIAGVVAGLLAADAMILTAMATNDPDFQTLRAQHTIWVQVVARMLSPVARGVLVAVPLAAFAGVLVRRPVRVGVGAILLGLILPLPFAFLGDAAGPNGGDANRAFVSEFVRQHPRADGRRPCVFWCSEIDLWEVWYHVPARSYHHPAQTSGVIFNRGTALEADRRTDAVKRFWFAHASWAKEMYQATPDDRPPTPELLREVAADPDLDWIVVPDHFPEFAPAGNGKLFIYDCRAIRGER